MFACWNLAICFVRKIALTQFRVELSSRSAILNGRSSLPTVCKLVAVERISDDAGKVARAQRRHQAGADQCSGSRDSFSSRRRRVDFSEAANFVGVRTISCGRIVVSVRSKNWAPDRFRSRLGAEMSRQASVTEIRDLRTTRSRRNGARSFGTLRNVFRSNDNIVSNSLLKKLKKFRIKNTKKNALSRCRKYVIIQLQSKGFNLTHMLFNIQ